MKGRGLTDGGGHRRGTCGHRRLPAGRGRRLLFAAAALWMAAASLEGGARAARNAVQAGKPHLSAPGRTTARTRGREAAAPTRTTHSRGQAAPASARATSAGQHHPEPRAAAPKAGPPTGEASSADEVPRPSEDDRDRERIIRLQETIGEILHGRTLGRVRVGMRVMSARTGRLFYGRRGDALMDPASNQKVLATTAALMRLGGDWRYRTEVMGPPPDDEGVIHGNIHLRGNGDPTLRSIDFDDLAARLRALGVTRVDGGVLADPRPLGYDGPASEDEPAETKAPLLVDRGLTVVRVRPGATPGSPAAVLTEQRRFSDESGGSGFVVHNQAVTKPSGRTRIVVKIESGGGALRVNVTGRISVGAAGVAFRRKVPHPALHVAVVLRGALVGAGIAVRGAPGIGAAPPSEGILDVHESPPLTVVLRRINKDSDNEQAERVLQTVGAEALGPPATTEKGLVVLRAVIGSLGLRPSSYVPHNGSGLGHANRITPNAMADLLRALYFDPRVGPEILQSLSVGGIDGTTRNRFRGTLASRRVRAKTGTLDGKSCLSGLVGDGDDVLVFSMMMQGFRGRGLAAVRASQVSAVNAMMRYVREGSGARVDLPVAADEQLAGSDIEAGGDNDESGADGDIEPTPPLKIGPGEDAVDAYLRQARGQSGAGTPASGAGGTAGTPAPTSGKPAPTSAPAQPSPTMPPPQRTWPAAPPRPSGGPGIPSSSRSPGPMVPVVSGKMPP
jgi:D-alanyl-D-alanine carboxypeptidase/D-alanyl-D-alanine-endopeptidase (penicillin-binding protein 4)